MDDGIDPRTGKPWSAAYYKSAVATPEQEFVRGLVFLIALGVFIGEFCWHVLAGALMLVFS